jgi:mannose-1-phosphate guanylyltransferase/mannose-6-phosphate isomerase
MNTKNNCDGITPVILVGGSGTRLWPLSRDDKPKQFQAIAGQSSMFQQTLTRITDPSRFTPPIIIGNVTHHEMIQAELREADITPAAVILEPEGRNTAPAVAITAMLTMALKLGEHVLVMPSDHYIRDPGRLISAIDKARTAAEMGAFVTFGITPDGPETSYGYIKQGEPLVTAGNDSQEIFKVARFVEKPPRHDAARMLEDGDFHWNSGMFLFPVKPLLQEMQVLKPGIIAACQQALVEGTVENNVIRPSSAAFAEAENISIDYAVMEKTARAAVVPVDPLWSDVGSWTAVWEISERDSAQNVTLGDVILDDVQGAYVRSEGPVTAVVGLKDVIVVNTGDAVIVAAKSHAQDIRRIAKAVRDRKSAENAPDPVEVAKEIAEVVQTTTGDETKEAAA